MESDLDRCLQLMHSDPKLTKAFLTKFDKLFPLIVSECSKSQEEGEVDDRDSFTGFEVPRGPGREYLKETNRINDSQCRGDPSRNPELSNQSMVTLQPRVTDPLGSILVPDTDLDELEVALLLTRMGNEPLPPVTSLPSCSDRNRSPEFDPGLAGEAPSGPRSSPGERSATSGTRSSGVVVLLGRTESQMERMLPRDEQDMLEDRQSLTPRNVDGHERRNETGA